MKKTVKIIAVFSVVLLCTVIASACLVSFTSQTTVEAKQSVVIDGKNWDKPVFHKIKVTGGCTKCFTHTVTNRGCKGIWLNWNITGTPDLEGINITMGSYQKSKPRIPCARCGDEGGYSVPLPSPFYLKPGQSIRICFCFELDMKILPGIYTITMILEPHTGK